MKKFLAVSFALLISGQAQSFNLTEEFANGFYWASLPVTFTVMDTNASRVSLISALAQEAVAEWEDAIIESLWNVNSKVGAPSSKNNIIRWTSNFAAETGLSEATTLAVAVRYYSGPYIARAEIIINGNHSINQQPELLRTVLIHELGHVMGLDHSQEGGAVMAAVLNIPYNGLHQDDVMGMEHTVSETKHRQAIGFVSPLAGSTRQSSEESSPLSCASVDMAGGSGGSGGGINPIVSLGFGLLLALLALNPSFKRQSA